MERDHEITVVHDENSLQIGNVFRRHIADEPLKKEVALHKRWLDSLQREYPMPDVPYKIGVYIRYYNQTKYENYIKKHIEQYMDDIALCKKWTLVDFYIDNGMNAPRMENAKDWCRLLGDCFSGRVDLIVTQKASNIGKNIREISLLARILAAQKHPVGIYCISDDLFTLASYYKDDLHDIDFIPDSIKPLPDDALDVPLIYEAEPLALTAEISNEQP